MRKRMNLACPMVCLTLVLGSNSPTLAGDINPPPGPIGPTMKTLVEVEPRTSVQTLPGSATALHVISEPGSYYLTGNINGVSGKNGIEVASDNVSIDLNGFALLGSAGTPSSAIAIPQTHSGLLVRNGLIQGWTGVAVAGAGTSNHSVVSDLIIAMPVGGGIAVGDQSFITRCVIETSGTSVVVGEGSIIKSCTITSHESMGIWVTRPDIHILDCIIRNGGNDGIRAGSRTVIRNCSVNNNRRAGIRVSGEKIVIIGNSCHDNGQGLVGHGIFVDGNFGSRVEGNYCTGNDIGIQAFGFVIRNMASGNGTNYLITGVVSNNPATASPWANLEN